MGFPKLSELRERLSAKLRSPASETSSEQSAVPQPPQYPVGFEPEADVKLPDLEKYGQEYSWEEETAYVKDAVSGARSRFKEHQGEFKWWQWFAYFFPCVEWIKTYDVRRNLLFDLVAGLSVAFMVVPQGMSYALLAGVPSIWGLYGAFVPVLIYAVFGSCRELAVGPVAVTSLIIGNGIKAIVPGSQFIDDPNNLDSFQLQVQKRFNYSVTQLGFLVAVLYTGVGALRLGFIIRFFSHPVITGFTTGASVIIAMSQMKYVLGYRGNIPRADTFHTQIQVLAEYSKQFKIQEFVMSMFMLTFLLTTMWIGHRYPKKYYWLPSIAPLLACILGILVVVIGGYNYWPGSPIRTIYNIPSGMPSVTITQWAPIQYTDTILPLAFVVMLVDMLESTSIARALARKNEYKLVYNREIVGLGIANFFGAAFNAYTVTGSFSRSAVANASGAKTQLAGLFTGFVVMFVLLFLTSVFELVPYNTVAAIIIAGCLTLFEYEVFWTLWTTNLRDCACWFAAALGVMFLGVEIGLCLAVGISFVLNILELAFPTVQVLGNKPNTGVFVDANQYGGLVAPPGLKAVRFQAPINFVVNQYIEDKVDEWFEEATLAEQSGAHPLQFVLLDITPATYIDSAGCHTVGVELADRLRGRGIQLILVGPNIRVSAALVRSGAADKVGRQWIFSNLGDAFEAVRQARSVIIDEDPRISVDKDATHKGDPPPSSSKSDVPVEGKALHDVIEAAPPRWLVKRNKVHKEHWWQTIGVGPAPTPDPVPGPVPSPNPGADAGVVPAPASA